jgi:hypothetical protein
MAAVFLGCHGRHENTRGRLLHLSPKLLQASNGGCIPREPTRDPLARRHNPHYQVIVCTVQRGTPNHMERIAQHLPITVAGSGDRFGIDAAEHLTRSQRLYRSLSPVDRRLDNAEVWGAEMSSACPDMDGILPPHTRCCQLHRLRHRCRLTSRSAFSWPCPA